MSMAIELDEASGNQRVQMRMHRFLAQAHRFANDSTAYFVRAALQVLTANQIEIHQQRALLQAEFENLVWKGERIRHRR